MKRLLFTGLLLAAALTALLAQINIGDIVGGGSPTIAIPDLRGSGDAQKFMGVFNQTLWSDVSNAGVFKMVAKSFYPVFAPQQLSDFVQPPAVQQAPTKRGQQMVQAANGGGRWLSDWANPPTSAKYLAFGYTGVSNGVLVLQGLVVDVTRDSPASGKVLEKRYLGSVDEAGARKVAHEFAADIVALLGGQSLFDTHIYFDSDRTGHREIWAMDADGKNQRQVTHYNSYAIQPVISSDGSRIAFTSYHRINPGIVVFSVDPVRDLRFYNQTASVNSSPSFLPDGRIIYSSSGAGGCCRIVIANPDGTGFRGITAPSRWIDTEPKVNPKTGQQVLFVSGRSGPQQIYSMNIDGGDIERVTDGTGEAAGPSWHPNGQFMAFSWTRGYSAGAWNVFLMNLSDHHYVQLTSGAGKNENPSWAPDGRHIVFGRKIGSQSQIYSMLADGTEVRQLTTVGSNTRPVWGK
jgi:TolB protein